MNFIKYFILHNLYAILTVYFPLETVRCVEDHSGGGNSWGRTAEEEGAGHSLLLSHGPFGCSASGNGGKNASCKLVGKQYFFLQGMQCGKNSTKIFQTVTWAWIL